MKFAKLYLKAFGPFSEQIIKFDASGASLHILYGPNEAGKSSLLRAIHAFLYGIPERTQDDFLHDKTTLRIGGLITDSADVQLAAMRRKARKQSLHRWNGGVGADCEGDALPDNVILHLLGDVDQAQFSRLFGIDRDELIQGGRAILEGKGNVGESLFEAGSGLVGLRQLRDSLEAEAGQLFAPRASKPLINSTVGEFEEAKRLAKDASVRTDDWTQLDLTYRTALNHLDAHKQEITAKRLERERLARILRNLPLLARREECVTELAGISGVPDLPRDFTEQRVNVLAGKASAEQSFNAAKSRVSELESRLKEDNVPEGYIERGTLIQGVYSRLGAHQQAELEIPGLNVRQHGLLEEARSTLHELGQSQDLAGVENLRPKKGDQSRLRDLIKEHSDLSGRSKELQRQEADLHADLEKAQNAFTTLKQPQDLGRLDDAVQATLVYADSERRLADLSRDITTRNVALERKVRSLGERTAVQLRALSAPSKATLMRLQQDSDAIASDRNVTNSQLAQRRSDLAARQSERQKLVAAGTVPSEEDVVNTREHRDQGWKYIRDGYIERTADPNLLGKEYAPLVGLPKAYEDAVKQADAVVDRVRLDTERIAKHALLQQRVIELSNAIRDDEAKLTQLDERQRKWLEEWTSITSLLGISIMTVRELEEWLGEINSICIEFDEIENREREIEELRDALSTTRGVLAMEMKVHDISDSSNDTFGVLLARARRLLENVRYETAAYSEARKAIDGLRRDLVGQQKRIEALETEYEGWRSRWNVALANMGLSKNVEPHDAEARLSLLQELFDAVDEAHRVEQELLQKQATVNRYSEEVGSLASALGVNGKGRSTSDVVVELFSQHQDVVRKAQLHEQLLTQLIDDRENYETSKEQLNGTNNILAELCRVAGVVNVTDVPAIEEKARRKMELQAEVAQIEKQLVEQNSATLGRIIEEANTADRDALNVQIPGLVSEIADLESLRDTLVQRLRDAEVALKKVDGSEKAADAAQRAQELLARLRTATEDYARLKISSFVITRAIEAYRQKHQGPILKLASQYFSTLTCQSFNRLDVDFSEDDRQILVGIRNNGKQVSVDGMSEGTRDQLYLALRLAAIGRYLETGPSIPVIVDDILVQFDDIRAKAAFQALGMLATRTQVLLLTHHSHLLPLAEQAVESSALAVHRLEMHADT